MIVVTKGVEIESEIEMLHWLELSIAAINGAARKSAIVGRVWNEWIP